MKLISALKKIFKRYMIAGTAVLVPLIGTYLILKFIIISADDLAMSLLPARLHPDELFGKDIPGLGLIATIILILIVGIFTRLYFGKKLVQLGDYIMSKIPLGRGIYSGIKQFMTAILTRSEEKFKSVVAVEYPRKGCWVLGFVTAEPISQIRRIDEKRLLNIFIPTTPNPTSGFLIMVPEEDTRPLDMGIDEAFKLLISGGIIQDSITKREP
jgi:uncharacterized membrane protein